MSRRRDDFLQERLVIGPFAHAQVADTDRTDKIWSPDRKFRIDRVLYLNVTGLAQHAANFFVLKILNAAAVAASWSTETGQQGTITANTFVEFVLSATDADLVVAAGADISAFFDEAAGTATLPTGLIWLEGRYVE